MKINAIFPCGGASTRAGLGYSKLKFNIGGMPLLCKTLTAFCRQDVSRLIIACADEDREWIAEAIENVDADITICKGGDNRTASVRNALSCVEDDCDLVIVHDGARPFVKKTLIDRTIACAIKWGNGVAALPVSDSLRIVENGISEAVDRSKYWTVQTPQIFDTKKLKEAYAQAELDDKTFSDDASLYEQYIGKIYLVEGDSDNTKITYASDLSRFVPETFFAGCGWDTHQLVEGRPLILGGVNIPHDKGLLGHSDADVLTHAIMDALLSASHNGDIGRLFPDTDPAFKNISSIILLKNVLGLLKSQGYRVGNVSATIMAQKPRLAEFIPVIEETLASAMDIDVTRVSITATTTEKLGLVGREEAISCNAYCALYQK